MSGAARGALLARARAALAAAEGEGQGAGPAWWVPGRIELLGKHTDYAGGRSLVAATARGMVFAARPRPDPVLGVLDALSGERGEWPLRPDLPSEAGWRTYPATVARRLARDKARAVPGAFVLGADTIVVLGEEILEKPADAEAAVAMLRRLQGRRHEVITSVCLVADGREHEAQDVTVVEFRPATEAALRAYVATGEPMDKAGAYGIQGYGAALVERIEGDFFSVMGLPVRLVLDLLARAGWEYDFGGKGRAPAA